MGEKSEQGNERRQLLLLDTKSVRILVFRI